MWRRPFLDEMSAVEAKFWIEMAKSGWRRQPSEEEGEFLGGKSLFLVESGTSG